LDESRSGLEENAARTAAQVERPEILHCLSEQGLCTRQKSFETSNSQFRGKNPCLARHAAPRCGIFSLQAVPFFEKIPDQVRDDERGRDFCRMM
jgi:hypothetical protein